MEEELITLSPIELRQYAQGQQMAEQTLIGSVVVPILQNILGGIGAGGLFAIGAGAVSVSMNFPIGQGLALWASLFGGFVACFFTAWRFFSDEIAIGRKLYQMGQSSRQAEIDALRAEGTALALEVTELKRSGHTVKASVATKRTEVIADAVKLLQWGYTGAGIDRRSCEQRGMSQTAWGKARRLLIASGCLGEDGQLPDPDLGAAKIRLKDYVGNRQRLAELESYVTPF